MTARHRDILRALFDAAVAAADPARVLPPFLPPPPTGRVILLAGGKAAASMLAATVDHYRRTAPEAARRLTGLGVTRYGYRAEPGLVELVEAGHPVPDQAGAAATDRVLDLAASATADDQVIVLLSGGASANWVAPAPGLSLADKQQVTRILLAAGASIAEINTIRRHLSRIKGGRLASVVAPARLITLAISDVSGDDPTTIGSGPTVADPSTLADTHSVVRRYGLTLPAPVEACLANPASETPKPDDPVFDRTEYRIVARPGDGLRAAAAVADRYGYRPILLGDAIDGEARDLAAEHARQARRYADSDGDESVALLSGGEATVTVTGNGRGGPNQEYALALAIELAGNPRVAAIACDTDGTDGGSGRATDPAGAIIDATTLARAGAIRRNPEDDLYNNDSTTFFETLGDLVETGPTFTNINDFRALLVDSPKRDKP